MSDSGVWFDTLAAATAAAEEAGTLRLRYFHAPG